MVMNGILLADLPFVSSAIRLTTDKEIIVIIYY